MFAQILLFSYMQRAKIGNFLFIPIEELFKFEKEIRQIAVGKTTQESSFNLSIKGNLKFIFLNTFFNRFKLKLIREIRQMICFEKMNVAYF